MAAATVMAGSRRLAGYLRGIGLVGFLVLTACATVVFCFGPLLLLHPVAPRLSLRWIRAVAAAWFACGVAVLESVIVCEIDVRGGTKQQLMSDVNNVLIVSNHFCRLDWLFSWMLELRLGYMSSKVIVLKSVLRHIPGIGWAMQLLRYVFLARNWALDQYRIALCIRSLQRDGGMSMLLYPEGTDLSKTNIAKAHEFAVAKGLQLYQNVLHPRSRGFVHTVNCLRRSGEPLAVWDLTVGYVGMEGGAGEIDFLAGRWPSKIHFRVSRWPGGQMPVDDAGLAQWLRERWAEKEQLLEDFRESSGARMLLPAEVDAGDVSTMVAGDSVKLQLSPDDHPPAATPQLSGDPFPWNAWRQTGAPFFLAFNFIVVPFALATSTLARSWLLWGSLAFVAVGVFGGLDSLLAGVPLRPKNK